MDATWIHTSNLVPCLKFASSSLSRSNASGPCTEQLTTPQKHLASIRSPSTTISTRHQFAQTSTCSSRNIVLKQRQLRLRSNLLRLPTDLQHHMIISMPRNWLRELAKKQILTLKRSLAWSFQRQCTAIPRVARLHSFLISTPLRIPMSLTWFGSTMFSARTTYRR